MALARALVLNPDILLLDEPLSNLDAKIRVQVRAEIRKLQQELGITTVYVTHDQEEALSLSDRVAVMRDGRVLQVARAQGALRAAASTASSPTSSAPTTSSPGSCTRAPAPSGVGRRDARSGPLRGRSGERRRRRRRCVLAVRPENVALGGAAASNARRRAGSRSPSYLGNTLRYDVETAAGLVLKVDVRDPWHHEPLPVGQPVHARASRPRSTLAAARRVSRRPRRPPAPRRARRRCRRSASALIWAVPDRLPRLPARCGSSTTRSPTRRGGFTLANFVEFSSDALLPALAVELAAPRASATVVCDLGARLRRRLPARPLRLRGPRASSATSR